MSIDTAKAATWIADNLGTELIEAELDEREIEVAGSDIVRATTLLAGIRSQGEFSVLLVNMTGGCIEAPVLTEALAEAFPASKIGARHGPHYLSLCRTRTREPFVQVRDGTVVPIRRRAVRSAAPQPLKTEDDPPVIELEVKGDVEAEAPKAADDVEAEAPKAADDVEAEAPKAADVVKAKQAKRPASKRSRAKKQAATVDA